MEVYRYDASARRAGLHLLRAERGRGRRGVGRGSCQRSILRWQAARIPGWETSLYPKRPLSEDGSRAFFESFDPLVLADTNGRLDVYEWEQAGTGGCEEADTAFVPSAGGCLYLISSGTSSADSEFVDASADGADVFIRTAQSLLSQDPGLYDIYDARIEGGFPPHPPPPSPCEGEACQSPPAPPPFPTPASSAFNSKGGNAKGGPAARNCPKGKRKVRRKGKTRCVAKHERNHKNHHRARHTQGRSR